MSARRWFHFHLSTALVVTLVASVLLGANLAWRSELLPMAISIGRGDSSVPVKAFFSPSYRGWPLRWDPNDKDFQQRVAVNAGSAAGILLFTLILCEGLIRRGERIRQQTGATGAMPWGLPPVLVTAIVMLVILLVLAWLNFVLHPDGAFAVRGWPFPYQAFLRADAVVTRETLEYWDSAQRNATIYAVVDGVVAAGVLIGMPVGARWWVRRSAPQG